MNTTHSLEVVSAMLFLTQTYWCDEVNLFVLWLDIPIQEAITQEGSGEAINQLYMTTMRKYEAIKDEYDSIRKRYSDLVASHSNNISKLELTQVYVVYLFLVMPRI